MRQNDIFRKSSLLLCTLEGKLEVKISVSDNDAESSNVIKEGSAAKTRYYAKISTDDKCILYHPPYAI